MAKGLTQEEARYAALREMGGVEQIKEECRDMRRVYHIDTFLQDVRYGLRQLRRSPGFTAVAVLTLALGIGANTAIFSVVNAVLLQALSFPYSDPDRLAYVYSGDLRRGFGDDISLADFEDWKARSHVFERMAAFEGTWFILTDDEPQRIHGDFISADWLPTLGVQPVMGRNFTLEEEQAGHERVVILSNDCWRLRFGADPNILAKRLTINDQSYAVVGVLPQLQVRRPRNVYSAACDDLFGRPCSKPDEFPRHRAPEAPG
jgi:putative ABC transport system permease protein